MPTYVYSCGDEAVERTYGMGKAPQSIRVKGRKFVRNWALEQCKMPARECWPVVSSALACHPDQVKEFSDFLSSRGVPTEFYKDGRCVVRDRLHRRDILRARGMVDLDSWTGY